MLTDAVQTRTRRRPRRHSLVRVLVISSDRLYADALQALMDVYGYLVHVAADREEASESASSWRPELVLLDLNLSGAHELVGDLATRLAGGGIIGLVGAHSPPFPATAAAPLTACLSTHLSADEFMKAVDDLADTLVSPAPMRGRVGLRDGRPVSHPTLIDSLTRREVVILTFLSEGMNCRKIAARLTISPNTARTHIHNIICKLKVHSQLEAVSLALQHGVIRLRAAEV